MAEKRYAAIDIDYFALIFEGAATFATAICEAPKHLRARLRGARLVAWR
jgi:hypothetical protein